MKTRQTSIRLSEATERQVQELTARGFGSFSEIVRTAVDRMSQQETGEMDNITNAAYAESVYMEVYGDIDHKEFHMARLTEISDWLAEGETVTDETVEELAQEWKREHTGDEGAIDRIGADDWVQVELEYWGLSQREVRARLDEMFPNEDNTELAARIYAALH